MTFPNDDNGDVLRRMAANGDDLTQARNIDFTVVFQSEASAHSLAAHFQSLGYTASIENTMVESDFPWDAVVVKNMVPAHDAIEEFEEQLQDVADGFGGRNDGWGCFSVPLTH
jgi:hypothetical protein